MWTPLSYDIKNLLDKLRLSDALFNMFFRKWFIYTEYLLSLSFVTLKLLLVLWNKIQFIFLQWLQELLHVHWIIFIVKKLTDT